MWRRAPPASPPERGARRQRVSRVGSADCARRADASSDPPGVRVEVSPRNRVRWSSRHPDVAHSPRPPPPRRPAVADPPHPDAAVEPRSRPPAAPRRVVDREPRPASGAAASARTRRATEGASRAPHTALGDSARAHPPPRERRANPRRRRRFGRACRLIRRAAAPPRTLSRRCSPPRCTPTLNLSDRNHRRDW